jgi:hypothetical protein
MNYMPARMSGPEFVDVSSLGGPRFLVTVDTEEEFDWSAPFSRNNHGTSHVPSINSFQILCEKNGVSPLYLIDYPIANDPIAIHLLGEYAALNKAAIGVQLHPWVNPPFEEELSAYNSFACNLSRDLEWSKLSNLHACIVKNFGVRPDIYRAGRYGAGPETPQMLAELGICFDTSVRSNFNYTAEGGPDYSNASLNPYWVLPSTLVELPLTSVFSGGLRRMGAKLYNELLSSQTSKALLSRAGLLERIALTPEGIPLAKAIEGIDCALEQGVSILNFSMHSPSLEPGHTGYVRDSDDLDRLYKWWDGVFAHLKLRGVTPVSVAEIKQAIF